MSSSIKLPGTSNEELSFFNQEPQKGLKSDLSKVLSMC